jgi:hypothetical protein
MSATGRKPGVRVAYDGYDTYHWCVDRLLEAVPLPGGKWLEPCAGSGSIIAAVNAKRSDVEWTAIEIQEKYRPNLAAVTSKVVIDDFLQATIPGRTYPPPFDVSITNPPYSLAAEVIEKCQQLAAVTVMLLRVNFLSSAERAESFRAWMPDVYVLPNRPNFNPNLGSGDATEYAWMVWNSWRVSGKGTIQTLAVTDKKVRQAEKLARITHPRARKRRAEVEIVEDYALEGED